MLQIFNCTSFLCLIIAIYVSFTGYKLYQMVNPLSGIEITGTYLQFEDFVIHPDGSLSKLLQNRISQYETLTGHLIQICDFLTT